jgi:hypothetical protein
MGLHSLLQGQLYIFLLFVHENDNETEKIIGASVRVVCNPAKIRTEWLLNKVQERYHYMNPSASRKETGEKRWRVRGLGESSVSWQQCCVSLVLQQTWRVVPAKCLLCCSAPIWRDLLASYIQNQLEREAVNKWREKMKYNDDVGSFQFVRRIRISRPSCRTKWHDIAGGSTRLIRIFSTRLVHKEVENDVK